MIPKNSLWHSLPEVQKGDYGEDIIQSFMEKKGYSCYKSVTNGSHKIDFLCMRDNGENFFVEVKTKARRRKYPDTGFNFAQYKTYKELSSKENKRIFICFVDPLLKKIYGNYLDILDKKRISGDKTIQRLYPSVEENKYGVKIIYFPIAYMEHIAYLSDSQLFMLKKLYKGSDDI